MHRPRGLRGPTKIGSCLRCEWLYLIRTVDNEQLPLPHLAGIEVRAFETSVRDSFVCEPKRLLGRTGKVLLQRLSFDETFKCRFHVDYRRAIECFEISNLKTQWIDNGNHRHAMNADRIGSVLRSRAEDAA